MKKIFLLLLICISYAVFSQNETPEIIDKYEELVEQRNFQQLIEEISSTDKTLNYLEEFYLGLSYFKIEQDPKAQQHLLNSIRLNNSFFRSHDYLAASYYFSGNIEDAEKEYLVCVSMKSDYDRGYFMLGNLYETENQIEKAIDSYKKALKINPDNESYNYRLGYVYFYQDNTDEARKLFLKVKQIYPGHYSATSFLLIISTQNGDFAKAEEYKDQIRSIWANTDNQNIKNLVYFQIDEFSCRGFTVIAKEKFEMEGDLYYHWVFFILDADNNQVKNINLESSAVIRELGTPYIIGSDEYKDGKRIHSTTGIGFKELPEYITVKNLVKKEIETGLESAATGVY